MQISKNKKRAAVVGGALGTAMVGMAAFAAFTGAGNFAAQGAVHDKPVSLTAAGGSIEQMYPGRCSDVTVNFANPNDHAAKIDFAHAYLNVASTLNGQPSNLLHLNSGAFNQQVVQAAQGFSVPAGGQADFTVPNALCLSTTATNAVASQPVALTGSVPFEFAPETEYSN